MNSRLKKNLNTNLTLTLEITMVTDLRADVF
jgi:hypothetical protein